MTTTPLASVVIPAYNERSVIARCLRALATGTRAGELDVIVVANGCHDDTAVIAKAEGAIVLETAEGGKARAIRLGDEQCRTFPRLYLDADSELSGDSVRAMVAALTRTGAPACAPTPEFDLTGASWPVRGFHRALRALLGDRHSLAGSGAYMLTSEGHQRVFPLPNVIADDGWVHRTFDPEERIVVGAARVSVRVPRTVAATIRTRARIRLGNRELADLGRPATEPPLRPRELITLVRRHEVTPLDAICFLSVLVAERVLGRWRAARGTARNWGHDQTARTAEGGP